LLAVAALGGVLVVGLTAAAAVDAEYGRAKYETGDFINLQISADGTNWHDTSMSVDSSGKLVSDNALNPKGDIEIPISPTVVRGDLKNFGGFDAKGDDTGQLRWYVRADPRSSTKLNYSFEVVKDDTKKNDQELLDSLHMELIESRASDQSGQQTTKRGIWSDMNSTAPLMGPNRMTRSFKNDGSVLGNPVMFNLYLDLHDHPQYLDGELMNKQVNLVFKISVEQA
jgi:hypothetical protein